MKREGLKRAFDLVFASVMLVILLPFLLLVALLVKLDSPGPALFRHERVGRNGRRFHVLKFRTMVVGAERMGSRLTAKRDPRITRIGQVLRWFKIDELPQLINVVRGEMSLIGPRPEDPYFVGFYTPEQRRVLSVRPGILGPSQIEGRDEVSMYPDGIEDTEAYYLEHILPPKLERDLRYVDEMSFWGDIKLLARGAWATVRGAIKGQFLWRRRYRIALFFIDLALVSASFLLANLLRRDFRLPGAPEFVFVPMAILLVVRGACLIYYGAYSGMFAYFGLWDLVALFKAVVVSAVIGAGLTYFVGLQAAPRSVFLIDVGLVLFMLASVRYVLRGRARRAMGRPEGRRRKALIVGAGVAGEQVARTLLEDPVSPYRPVGFIDEVQERWGATIHGVPVLGGVAELRLALSANGVDAVFLCSADIGETTLEEAVRICKEVGVEYRVVPALSELLAPETATPRDTAVRVTAGVGGRA